MTNDNQEGHHHPSHLQWFHLNCPMLSPSQFGPLSKMLPKGENDNKLKKKLNGGGPFICLGTRMLEKEPGLD